ncbi:MAG: hypothetical protein ABR985_04225 [Methanotrichaceae archaeon]|jgi:hypothetical protein
MTIMVKLIGVLAILAMASTVYAFEISSTNPGPGETVTITGNGNPGQEVQFQTSFQKDMPVNSGQYQYEASGVEVPQKPNRFAVTVEGVKDLNVGVKIGIWISKEFKATNGVASISQSDVPPGRYDLRVFGDALEGRKSVSMDVLAETTVKADSGGKYSLSVDTSGITDGAYKIEGAGETKTIQVGGRKETSNIQYTDSGSSGQSDNTAAAPGSLKRQETPVAITPEVVTWYAGHIGLDPKNQEQYSKAEKGLNNMVSKGNWKVIARDDPLTEKAGNCQDVYCLVRGVDACTTCRQEEMLLLSAANKKTQATNVSVPSGSDTNETKNSSSANQIGQNKENGNQKGLIEWLIGLVQRILGII